MIVRVFMPRAVDPADGSTFRGTDHNFPVLPSIGQVLRFTDERAGDFTVAKIGFVQDGDAFLAAAWLEATDTRPAIKSDPMNEADKLDRYRDLNYDVPPDSMTGY